MHHLHSLSLRPALLIVLVSLFSCSGSRPDDIGIVDSRLTACPSTPNCVSSDADDSQHHVEPFLLSGEIIDWSAVVEHVQQLPRTTIITRTADYLHAECSSLVFGFVDDLELHLRPDNRLIAVRSASRLGHSDFGVNRKRIEQLRQSLKDAGLIR